MVVGARGGMSGASESGHSSLEEALRECGMNGQVMPTATAPPDLLLTPTKLTGHHFVGKEV